MYRHQTTHSLCILIDLSSSVESDYVFLRGQIEQPLQTQKLLSYEPATTQKFIICG